MVRDYPSKIAQVRNYCKKCSWDLASHLRAGGTFAEGVKKVVTSPDKSQALAKWMPPDTLKGKGKFAKGREKGQGKENLPCPFLSLHFAARSGVVPTQCHASDSSPHVAERPSLGSIHPSYCQPSQASGSPYQVSGPVFALKTVLLCNGTRQPAPGRKGSPKAPAQPGPYVRPQCRLWQQGYCKFRASCKFQHGRQGQGRGLSPR